jgi:hypothetical protein
MVNLSWVIRNNWVGDYKKVYSQETGRDIGTPATVDRMIARSAQLKSGCGFLTSRPYDMGLIGMETDNRDTLIEAYLLFQSLQDDNEKDQLEGELKRFVAQTQRIPPENVRLTPNLVWAYLMQNRLVNAVGRKIAARFGYEKDIFSN